MSNPTLIDQFAEETVEAIQDASPSLERLEKLFQEAKDMLAGPYYKQQPSDQQDLLKDAKRDLEAKIKELRSVGSDGTDGNGSSGDHDDQEKPGSAGSGEGQATAESIHDSRAEEWMNKAESAFYAGRYNEAIGFYNEVLKIERTWDRARQHKEQAQGYLDTGHIPTNMLPPEAAVKFGKAQSAFNLINLKRARELYDDVKEILAKNLIIHFVEGDQFEEKLNNAEEAESSYKNGLENFNQGNIDEAINSIQLAADNAGVPLYKEKVIEFREVRDKVNKVIRPALFARPLVPELVLTASAELSELLTFYGENPFLKGLHTQQISATNQIAEKLFDLIGKKLDDAERASSISSADESLKDIKDHLESLEETGKDDKLARKLAYEEKRLRDVKQKIENAVETLRQAKDAKARKNSLGAWKLVRQLRQEYPSDPEVVKLGQQLELWDYLRNGLIAIGILVAIAVILLLGQFGFSKYHEYLLNLTPSPTPTATVTSTPTFTLTPTFTPSNTPTPTFTATATLTPSLTPTPLTMMTTASVWARNDCYEGNTAVGLIPASSIVYLLPAERRFDKLQQECVLVEYKGSPSVTGWVLLLDLEP